MSASTTHNDSGRQRLRLLSYNIQVGIRSIRPHHYVTNSWKHLLPHACRFRNLDRMAKVIGEYDIVGLQEVDAGSLRTGNINLAEYLARMANLPFWHHQCNRNLARVARHSNGLLSRFRPSAIDEHRLPGLLPGRGGLVARFGHGDDALVVIMLHLALGSRTRLNQLDYIGRIVNAHRHVVLMGDLNCQTGSREMDYLFRHTHLREPLEELHTFPSWQPQRHIDHILVTPELEVEQCQVINEAHSDHLPIAMHLRLPVGLRLH